jgi:hypothetical protein
VVGRFHPANALTPNRRFRLVERRSSFIFASHAASGNRLRRLDRYRRGRHGDFRNCDIGGLRSATQDTLHCPHSGRRYRTQVGLGKLSEGGTNPPNSSSRSSANRGIVRPSNNGPMNTSSVAGLPFDQSAVVERKLRLSINFQLTCPLRRHPLLRRHVVAQRAPPGASDSRYAHTYALQGFCRSTGSKVPDDYSGPVNPSCACDR